MSVPVAWVSYHEPDIIRRGYWDQGLLERVINRSLWRPPGALEYRHYAGIGGVPPGAGAVVVVPAQHHTSAQDVRRLNDELAKLPWALVLLTGDECSLFPWKRLSHQNMRLWVMTPQPERHALCPGRFIGEGWRYDTPDVIATFAQQAEERPFDWFFAGQVTHWRRERLAAALAPLTGSGSLVETPGFTQGLDREDYLRRLTSAKIAPCPAGACTPDSFRLYEALEAGTLPLLDDTSPKGWSGFWDVMGDARPPCPVVDDWAGVAEVIRDELDHWPANANRAFAWWQGYKRRLTVELDDDVLDLSEGVATEHTLADLVTVLVSTSPIPSHPSTAIITETLESIRARLPGCEILVMVDGVRPEQEGRTADYEEYQRRLLRLTNLLPNVMPLRFEHHMHQAAMTRAALELVRTPLVLFVEHDTPLCGEIPWEKLGEAIATGDADVVRLHHEAQILEPHRYLMAGHEVVCGAELARTAQWSQRPHLASAAWYRRMLDEFFPPNARTMIEDRLYGVIATPWVERRQWGRICKLWLYTPPGDMKRSLHLDGRAGDPKYEMTW